MTAHTLEEGHYVIGPKIDIPLQYPGVATRDRWCKPAGRGGSVGWRVGVKKGAGEAVGDQPFLEATGMSEDRAGRVVIRVVIRVRAQWFLYSCVEP